VSAYNDTGYSLARSLFEDSPDKPLPQNTLRDTIFAAAMNAYDNASNPNRTRGGLKKCDEMYVILQPLCLVAGAHLPRIHAFPKTMEKSVAATHRVEALLQATHTLSQYRLVLKQGEPFTPVVLRAHSDPLSIVGRILEQNPKSYTRIQDLLDLGTNIVEAGLTGREKSGHSASTPEKEPHQLAIAERRIMAMCIDAALTEDDFETAYSYVVNRLCAIRTSPPLNSTSAVFDDYSWKAALQAGKYRRTARTLRPSHLGTSRGNLDIRHLEQRIDCLATALRIAPPITLQEIVNTYRRCEEELDAAIAAEAASEEALDAEADVKSMPGGFGVAPAASAPGWKNKAEEAPMSLFDLSRESVLSAQRNLTALSGLQRSGLGRAAAAEHPAASSGGEGGEDGQQPKRVRKRDQLRDAAMGTLVSGVGWLVGAQPVDHQRQERG
jgi:hypothetical protein